MKFFSYIFFVVFLLQSCKPTTLRHERYIFNNTGTDTIVVVNPDFDDAIDTILPNDEALIYVFEQLTTNNEYEPCLWLGDTLIIKTLADIHLTRSVKEEDFWTHTVTGEKDQIQKCTFIITSDDF